jgi:hypothetical protein
MEAGVLEPESSHSPSLHRLNTGTTKTRRHKGHKDFAYHLANVKLPDYSLCLRVLVVPVFPCTAMIVISAESSNEPAMNIYEAPKPLVTPFR